MIDASEIAHVAGLVAANRHLFIEASAGSGKTTRLVNLVAEIIATEKATIEQLLCVTFTEKAASELKARIYQRLSEMPGAAAKRATENFSLNAIGTIHSFCLKSLAHDKLAALAGVGRDSADDHELFEEAREWVYRTVWSQIEPEFLASLLKEAEFGAGGSERTFDKVMSNRALWCFSMNALPLDPPAPEITEISSLADFLSFTLAKIVGRMREIADAGNALSFSRMITLMADSLTDDNFAATIRQRYAFALIDEFQDTDEVQWRIFKTLFLKTTPADRRVMIVVGDPKQAIYKFRGADVFVYLQAKSELTALGAMTDDLTRSYRSIPEILQPLNHLFTAQECSAVWQRAGFSYYEAASGSKSLSTRDDCSGIEIYHAEKFETVHAAKYCRRVADRIAEIRSKQPDWTIAVIAYKHASLKAVADELRALAIDYAYYGEKPDSRRLDIEHLKVFTESFAHEFGRGFSQASSTLFLYGHADAVRYYETLTAMLAQGKILRFLQTLAQDFRPLHTILNFDRDVVQYHAWRTLFQNLLSRCGRDIYDLYSLRVAISALKDKDATEEATSDMLRSRVAVQLLTVQSSKGLDWNVVVLADGAKDARWKDYPFFHDREKNAVVPADVDAFDAGQNKLMTSAEESEITQLNLLYVAMTRAKHKFITYSLPAQRESSPGPVAAFLYPWLSRTNPEQNGVVVYNLATLEDRPRGKTRQAPVSPPKKPDNGDPGLFDELQNSPLPLKVDHGDILQRVREKRSFTSLAKSDFTALEFPDDVLPRGAEIGQLLHSLLETCIFANLKSESGPEATALLARVTEALIRTKLVATDKTEPVARRIVEIMFHCANATLQMGKNRGVTRLSDVDPVNLWREMPFWSSEATHAVLRSMAADKISRTMHGFMDLVFTPNGSDYYILDYKSNSVADVSGAELDQYIDAHYSLQREIYGEALQLYLQRQYPGSGRKVRGCYFLFLRYLKSGESVGVQFKEYADA